MQCTVAVSRVIHVSLLTVIVIVTITLNVNLLKVICCGQLAIA